MKRGDVMEQYRYDQEVNQKIVDGILQGYKNYVDERNEKKEKMKISSAYAWVKGNHIDDQTAALCSEKGIEFRKAKAGYTWGYLQFLAKEERKIFIVKNAKYFNKDNFPAGRNVNGKKNSNNDDDNYLKKLSKINKHVEFPYEPTLLPPEEKHQQLLVFDDLVMKSLEDNEVSRLQVDFDYFYIITYEIDEANMISSIQQWMPNPENNKAYRVEDLTKYIESSVIDLSTLDTSVLENDKVEYDYELPNAVDFGIEFVDDIVQQEDGTKKS